MLDINEMTYCTGGLMVIDKTLPDRQTSASSTIEGAKERLLDIINADDDLQVAAVGNPVEWDGAVWATNLRYYVCGDLPKGLTVLEYGHVGPSDYEKNGIWLRPAFKYDRDDREEIISF